MAQLAAEHDLLVTVEEGVLAGGFGSAVLGDAQRDGRDRRRGSLRVGLPDRYVTHGKPALLHEEVGFTGERIAERGCSRRSPITRPRARSSGTGPGSAGSRSRPPERRRRGAAAHAVRARPGVDAARAGGTRRRARGVA